MTMLVATLPASAPQFGVGAPHPAPTPYWELAGPLSARAAPLAARADSAAPSRLLEDVTDARDAVSSAPEIDRLGTVYWGGVEHASGPTAYVWNPQAQRWEEKRNSSREKAHFTSRAEERGDIFNAKNISPSRSNAPQSASSLNSKLYSPGEPRTNAPTVRAPGRQSAFASGGSSSPSLFSNGASAPFAQAPHLKSFAPSSGAGSANSNLGVGGLRTPERGARRNFQTHAITNPDLLGTGLLKPPPPDLTAPKELFQLDSAKPLKDSSGAVIPPNGNDLNTIENLEPPANLDKRRGGHWDEKQWHNGSIIGSVQGGRWYSEFKNDGRWWTYRPQSQTAYVRSQGFWWTKSNGVWCILHDGTPWAVRHFRDWNANGLVQPDSQIEMVYSRDLTKVAVVTPEKGAEVFDAVSGDWLGHVEESALRRRDHPAPPQWLSRDAE